MSAPRAAGRWLVGAGPGTSSWRFSLNEALKCVCVCVAAVCHSAGTPDDMQQGDDTQAMLLAALGNAKRCNCKKARCLKLYCVCFAAGACVVRPRALGRNGGFRVGARQACRALICSRG